MSRSPHKAAWDLVTDAVHAGNVESTLEALADWMDVEAQSYAARPGCDENVKAALESSARLIREAAFDFYVSLK